MKSVPALFRRRISATILLSLLGCLALATAVLHHKANASSHGIVWIDNAAPELGILVDQNLQVVAVDGDGAAARAGFHPGDVLRKISGFPLPDRVLIDPRSADLPTAVPASVRTSNQVKAAFHAAVPAWEDSTNIVLNRNGKVLTLRVLVTSQPFHYDSANPPSSVTPVPSSMDATHFYM